MTSLQVDRSDQRVITVALRLLEVALSDRGPGALRQREHPVHAGGCRDGT
ncbi:hypothetical protein [Mycobacterium sp. 94-17]|nr:hypothetical protein [Mycobacterium sp. 94-17]MEB4207763.1 hypothetical protein [Mycobacterium sp. 94-17]